MYMRSAVLIRRMMKSQRTAVGEGVQKTLGCSGGGGGRWATWRGGSVSALTALAVLLPEADDTAQTRGALYGAAAEEEKGGGLGQVGVRHHREDHSAAAHHAERKQRRVSDRAQPHQLHRAAQRDGHHDGADGEKDDDGDAVVGDDLGRLLVRLLRPDCRAHLLPVLLYVPTRALRVGRHIGERE